MNTVWKAFKAPVRLAFLCGLTLFQAFAQDAPKDLTELPLEDLTKMEVYSASKFNQRITEAPASISIITAADIQHYGYRKMPEILNSVAGFFTTNDRNYEYLGTRGFGRYGDYNTRILFLLNGLRLNESVYGGSGIGFDFPLDINLIERIEIVRGPGSSLYGSSAFLGTVNIITKRGRSLEGGRVYAEGGSLNTYAGSASFGKAYKNGTELLLSASYRNSKGQKQLYFQEFDTPETNRGVAENLDGENNTSFFANVSRQNLTAQFVFNTRSKAIPTAPYGSVFNDRGARTRDTNSYIDLKYERSLQHNWNIAARTYLGFYNYTGAYEYEHGSGSSAFTARNFDLSAGRWWGGDSQITRTFSEKHHITLGADWQHAFHLHQWNYDEEPRYFRYLDILSSWATVGVYLQGEFAVRNNLLVSAGLRHDQYNTFGGNTSPRLGIVYSPLPKTTLKLLHGRAFRAPNTYELFYQDGFSQKSNPDLRPEKIRTTEFVLEQYLGTRFRAAGSVYHYNVKGLIAQESDSDGLDVFRNTGQTNATGMELALEGKDLHGFDGRISYTLQRASNEITEDRLANSPKHIAQFNLFVPCFSTHGGAGIEMQYKGSGRTLRGEDLGGFLVMNTTLLFKNLIPNLDVSAGVYNVLDRRYSDPAGEEHTQSTLLQDGRSFRIRIGYGFGHK